MLFSQWIKTYISKKVDFDGYYGVQCVDLIDCYIDKCLSLKIGFWGNAKNWWNDRNTSKWLKDNFEFITPNYKPEQLKAGDIGVRTSGTYGHIFVIKSASGGSFTYYDQNGTGNGDIMTERTKPLTSSYINGILRPKNRTMIDTDIINMYFTPNARMKNNSSVYGDSQRNINIGVVSKNERVKILFVGETNTFIQYAINKTAYKVGIVYTKDVIKD